MYEPREIKNLSCHVCFSRSLGGALEDSILLQSLRPFDTHNSRWCSTSPPPPPPPPPPSFLFRSVELQEEARRQARETGGNRFADSSRSSHEPLLAVADDADRLTPWD